MSNNAARIVSIVALLSALVLYATAQGFQRYAFVPKVVAVTLGAMGIAAAEWAFFEKRGVIRVGVMVSVWMAALLILGRAGLPTSARYLILDLCLAASIAFFDGAMGATAKRIVFGIVALASVLPALLAIAIPELFGTLFGTGSAEAMGLVAILAAGTYAFGWITWTDSGAEPVA